MIVRGELRPTYDAEGRLLPERCTLGYRCPFCRQERVASARYTTWVCTGCGETLTLEITDAQWQALLEEHARNPIDPSEWPSRLRWTRRERA